MTSQVPAVVVASDGSFCRAAFNPADWSCPECEGKGGYYCVEGDYEVFRACACRQTLRRLELFNSARIGRRYADATLENYLPTSTEQQRALQMARDFTLMFPQVGGGLLLFGPVGTGKTHLAVGIFRELTLQKGVSCRFVDCGNLMQDLRRSFGQSGGEAALMLPLVNVELLVIDELGKGLGTDWEETVLDDLISRRYNAGRITLCTSNFAPGPAASTEPTENPAYSGRSRRSAGAAVPTLRERVGERIFSRLCEMCEFVEVPGQDYRRSSGQGVTRRSG